MKKITAPSLPVEAILANANTFNTWFSILPSNLQPKKIGEGYGFAESGGLSLYRSKTGEILLHNFSQKLDLPSGNLFQVVCHLHHLQPKGNYDDLRKACEIIAAASGQTLSVNHSARFKPLKTPPARLQVSEVVQTWVPNAQKAVQKNFDFRLADCSGIYWKAILKYFSAWGITDQTLQKYGVRPLLSIQKAQWTKPICFHAQDIAFAYCINQSQSTIKAKHPAAIISKKQLKEFYLQNTGNYVFGWNQLPQTGKVLIIAAGEKDTLTINQHLNKFGIFAVCYSSENAKINPGHLQILRTRFEQVFTCFDNDSKKTRNTGKINMHKLATEQGIPFVDIAAYVPEKDVSDIVERHGALVLEQIFMTELATKTAVAQRLSDKFSIGVADALRLDIQTYLSERLELLGDYILQNPKLILQSSTGTGKTWAFMKLAAETDFLEKNQFRHLVFCVPTTAILEQLERDFESECGTKPHTVQGCSSEMDIQEAQHSRLVLATYDSLYKISAMLEDAILVVDEFHELRNAHHYRETAVQEVFDFMQIAKRVVAISATPIYALTVSAQTLLGAGYRLCKVNCRQAQQILVQPYIYEEGAESGIFNHRLTHTKDFSKTHIIKKNSVAMLEAFQHKALLKNQTFDIFSSKSPQYKSESPNYQSIMQTGKLAQHKNWLGCTSLFDAGASFRFAVGSVTFINERCADSFVQHVARARINTKTQENEALEVFAYHTKPKPQSVFARLAVKNFEALLEQFTSLAKHQADFCNQFNQDIFSTHKDAPKKYLESNFIYYSPLFGEWRMNTLAILAKIQQLEQEESSLEDFYERISYYYPHIKVRAAQTIQMAEDAHAQETLGEKRLHKKTLTAQFHEIWQQNHPDSLLEAAWHSTQNISLKKLIQKHTIIQKKNISDKAQSLLEDFPKIFELEIPQKYILRFLKIRKLGFTAEVAQQMVTRHPKQASFIRFYNTLVAQIEKHLQESAPQQLPEQSQLRLAQYKKIELCVEHLKQSVQENPDLGIKQKMLGLTALQLQQHLKKALGQHLSVAEAKIRAQELYQVRTTRTKRKGKQLVIFELSDALVLQDLLTPYGIVVRHIKWDISAA